MTVHIDVELGQDDRQALARTDPRWWFTGFEFANASSPPHPHVERLELASRMKREMVMPTLSRLAPGSRVLDVFCANGAFSFEAALHGASEVLGVDYDPPRIECARFVRGLLDGQVSIALPRFEVANVYELPASVEGPFDLTFALGGLYHVSDPVLVLDQLRAVTRGHLVLQTSRIIRLPGSWAKFITVRRAADRTDDRGAGVWKLSPKALETMLSFTGFEIVERFPVPRVRGRRVPWYGAVCRTVER
jgi:2-polyprenyl-3-methyl-5-hydroxy-6-metoxy-1,4-benzoquinol methylase